MRVHLLLAFVLLASGAQATTRAWPTGLAPCNNIASLQACVNAAGSGDVIEISANAIPAQSVSIPASSAAPKSLTLRPAAGFTPVFGDFTSIFALGGDVDVTIVIEGLTIQRGTIIARQGGEGTFDVTVRNNKILNISSSNTGIEISSANTQPPYGPTHFLVENNQIDVNVGATATVSAISTGGFQGGVNLGTIIGNVIHQIGGGQANAINIANGEPTLQVDVIRNRIFGTNVDSAIFLYQFSPSGTLSARVIDNVISSQPGSAGAPRGLFFDVSDGTGAFTVLNNTLAYNQTGLLLTGLPSKATVSGLIANNIFAFNSQSGIAIDDFGSSVVNESNLVFGNGSNFFTPGTGTVFADPRLVSTTNLGLRSGSPARDAGDNSKVPADITTDVAGAPRIRDGIVDIGAFEDGDDYLLLNNQCGGSLAHLPTALADLGLNAVQTTTMADFASALNSGTSWDLVLVDQYSDAMPPDVRAALRDYIDNGGRAYMNSWDWDAQTAATFGAVLGSPLSAPPLHVWDAAHPLVSDPEHVGDTTPGSSTCGGDAHGFQPVLGARAIAGSTAAPASNQAGLIVANGGRTVLLGTTPGLYPAASMLPLLRNVIRFLLSPDILLLDGQCGASVSQFPAALDDLELAFQHTTTGAKFDGWLSSGKDWRLVIVDSYGESPGNLAALRSYVQNGGHAWWNGASTDVATAGVFETTLGARYSSPRTVRRWNGACCGPQHPLYRAPAVGPVQTPNQDACSFDGYDLGIQGEGVALAGSTAVPTPGQAALIAGNHGRTLFFGGAPGNYPASQIVPFLRGAVSFLLSGYPLYTTEFPGPVLRTIDPTSARSQSGVAIQLAGTAIRGSTALAMDPLSGTLWAVVLRDSGQDLVRIDPDSGVATLIGPLAQPFVGLAFDCRGNLFGVTGDLGDGDFLGPASLYRLDTASAAQTLLMPVRDGRSGEALAFNPADESLYYGSAGLDLAFEAIDPDLAISPIALSGDAFAQFQALTVADPARLLLSDGTHLFDLGTTGTATLRGPLDHFAKGLANTDVRCCSDPGDADCDGRPNAIDLCPFYFEQNPTADANRNGRGDECECGDAMRNGRVDVSDLVGVNICIFNPDQCKHLCSITSGEPCSLCDANGDGACNVLDIVAANQEIFSPGNSSTCERQPVPGP